MRISELQTLLPSPRYAADAGERAEALADRQRVRKGLEWV